MANKENIYNNIGQINVNDVRTPTESRTSGYTKLTNRCIICGNDCDGFEVVCDECKEAINWLKQYKYELTHEATEEFTKTTCPHCGSFNTQYMYGTSTLYDYDKGCQSLTTHFICKDCHKEFDIGK